MLEKFVNKKIKDLIFLLIFKFFLKILEMVQLTFFKIKLLFMKNQIIASSFDFDFDFFNFD